MDAEIVQLVRNLRKELKRDIAQLQGRQDIQSELIRGLSVKLDELQSWMTTSKELSEETQS